MKRLLILQWFLLIIFLMILGISLNAEGTVPLEPVIIFPTLLLLLEIAKRKMQRKKQSVENAKIVKCRVFHVALFSHPIWGLRLIIELDGKRTKTSRLTTGESFALLFKEPSIFLNMIKNSFTWIVKMHDIEDLSLNFHYLPEEKKVIYSPMIN